MTENKLSVPEIHCDHCNRAVESTYGDPDEPDEDR